MKNKEVEDSKEFFDKDYRNLTITDSSLSFSITDKKIYDKLISLVKKSSSIMDLGCGNGGTLRIFRKLNKKTLLAGVDFSNIALKYAKKAMGGDKKLKLINADLNYFKSGKEKYDLVYCSQVLEHLHKPKSFLKNVYELLEPGGSVVLSTVYKVKGAWYFYKNKFNERALTIDHINEYNDTNVLLDQLERAGFNEYDYSLVQVKYPLVDPLIKLLARFIKKESFLKFCNSDLFMKVRSCVMVPILGFYYFQIVAKKT